MNMYNPSGNMYGQPVSGNHSDRMEIAAMTLGIISIVSCTCLYLAIPCGALAIKAYSDMTGIDYNQLLQQ